MRDTIQGIQDDLNDNDHKLKDTVQPLAELKEREVGTPEIRHIRDVLLQMLTDVQGQIEDLNNLDDDMEKLLHEADDLINRDKLSRLEEADQKRKELDA